MDEGCDGLGQGRLIITPLRPVCRHAAAYCKGSVWDPSWRSSTESGGGESSQLHLLLSAFPPHRDDVAAYKQLLKSALEHGLSPSAKDGAGRTAAFVLFERMASTPTLACPESARIVQLLLQVGGVAFAAAVSNGADRLGRSVLDIEDLVPHSCLAAVRPLLMELISSASSSTGRSLSQSRDEGNPHHLSLDGWVLEGDSGRLRARERERTRERDRGNNKQRSSSVSAASSSLSKLQALSNGLEDFIVHSDYGHLSRQKAGGKPNGPQHRRLNEDY